MFLNEAVNEAYSSRNMNGASSQDIEEAVKKLKVEEVAKEAVEKSDVKEAVKAEVQVVGEVVKEAVNPEVKEVVAIEKLEVKEAVKVEVEIGGQPPGGPPFPTAAGQSQRPVLSTSSDPLIPACASARLSGIAWQAAKDLIGVLILLLRQQVQADIAGAARPASHPELPAHWYGKNTTDAGNCLPPSTW